MTKNFEKIINDASRIFDNKLEKLDKEVADFYKLMDRYFDSMNNLYGKKIYRDGLKGVLSKLEKIKPKNEFDILVKKNIDSNLRLSDLLVEYFTEIDFKQPIESFFDKLAGKGAFDYLKYKATQPLWKEAWEMREKSQEDDYAYVNRFTKEAQKAARAWLPKIKRDVLEYGKKEGYLPDNFDFNIILLAPKEGDEHSSWNSRNKMFSLGFYGFDFYLQKNQVIANPVRSYDVAFHEILGHAAHQNFSKKMPYSLRFTEEMGGLIASKMVTEGVAAVRQQESSDLLLKKKNELGVSKNNIEILILEKKLAEQYRLELMLASLLKDKESIQKGYDGSKMILKLTKNPLVARYFKNEFDSKFNDVCWRLGHALGSWHYGKMVDRMNQKFGKKYIQNNKIQLSKASMMGFWSWEVYSDAIEYFLKKMKNNSVR